MLPAKNRLPSQDIKQVKLKGNKCFSPHFKLIVLLDAKLAHSVWQIKIYKKTLCLATDRNQQKRILRSLVQKINPQIKTPAKIILQLNNSIEKIDKNNLLIELKTLCQKANVL